MEVGKCFDLEGRKKSSQKKTALEYIPSLNNTAKGSMLARPNIRSNKFSTINYNRFGALIDALHGEENKSTFLKKAWQPRRGEVTTRILERPVDRVIDEGDASTMIFEEFKAASQVEKAAFIESCGKKYLDFVFDKGWKLYNDKFHGAVYVADRLGDIELMKYALKTLKEKTSDYSPGYYEGDIIFLADAVGDTSAKNSALSIKLDRQMRHYQSSLSYDGGRYHTSDIAKTLEELGRHKEAIDWYLKYDCASDVYKAFRIVKAYVPEKLKDIAEKGYGMYAGGYVKKSELLEYAEVLGKTEEAKKIILDSAMPLEEHPWSWNDELVKPYIESHKDKAIDALWKLVKQTDHCMDNIKRFADVIGDKERVRPAIRYKAMLDAESRGDYRTASILARSIGETDQAAVYDQMYELTREGNIFFEKNKPRRPRALKEYGV